MPNQVMQDRELWLNAAATLIREHVFATSGLPEFTHPYRLSCGFPKGGRRTIGACHPRAASTDATNEIFVTPEKDDPIAVLKILTHELIHALDDCQHGHSGDFARWARAVGFIGKLTTAHDVVDGLLGTLRMIALACGAYPHGRLTAGYKPKDGIRQLKVSCNESGCGAVWRASAKWAYQMTACPVCERRHITVHSQPA